MHRAPITGRTKITKPREHTMLDFGLTDGLGLSMRLRSRAGCLRGSKVPEPQKCRIIAVLAFVQGLGLLFCILLGFG